MAKITSNKSLRLKGTGPRSRRAPIVDDETTDRSRATGASGEPGHAPRRPGRAASLLSSNARSRSQKWRTVASGKLKRRANPAERAQKIRTRSRKAQAS